jgi:hypothetical protein
VSYSIRPCRLMGGVEAIDEAAIAGPGGNDEAVILFLAANPSDTGRLALDREARAIHVELKRSGYRDRFDFVTRWAAEPLDLLRELRELRPTTVHFSGHGARPFIATDPAQGREVIAPAERRGAKGFARRYRACAPYRCVPRRSFPITRCLHDDDHDVPVWQLSRAGSPVRSVFSLPGARSASRSTTPARPRPRPARQVPPQRGAPSRRRPRLQSVAAAGAGAACVRPVPDLA